MYRRIEEETNGRDVLFIDASKQYESGKNQNQLSEENVEHILELYRERKDVDKQAHLASFDEIEKNDFNLNIPRYIDTSEKEPEIDIDEVYENLQKDDEEIRKASGELNKAFTELGLSVRL